MSLFLVVLVTGCEENSTTNPNKLVERTVISVGNIIGINYFMESRTGAQRSFVWASVKTEKNTFCIRPIEPIPMNVDAYIVDNYWFYWKGASRMYSINPNQ